MQLLFWRREFGALPLASMTPAAIADGRARLLRAPLQAGEDGVDHLDDLQTAALLIEGGTGSKWLQ